MILLNKVLIVEDTASIRRLVEAYIGQVDELVPVAVSSLSEAKKSLEERSKSDGFLCAILDLNLPDAPNGEIVDFVQQFEIPVIVLTGSIDGAVKQTMNSKFIIDYVIKRSSTEIEYVASLVKNLYRNQFSKVLIVDDSESFQGYLLMLLGHLRYIVLVASDGVEALKIVADNPDVSLVITDYNMPNMNGMLLIEEIRKNYKREEISILAMSSVSASRDLTVQLLKLGANDYLNKPFMIDEFYCRVSQSVNMIRNVRTIKESATTDYLTKINNRQSLFDLGEVLYANAKRGTLHIAVAMIDADFFKKINDTYGHDAGDVVLVTLAAVIKQAIRTTDIVARFGGEEFVCVTVFKNPKYAFEVFDRIRSKIEDLMIKFDETNLKLTVSTGVTTELGDDFEGMINRADKALYRAKNEGRNCVIVD